MDPSSYKFHVQMRCLKRATPVVTFSDSGLTIGLVTTGNNLNGCIDIWGWTHERAIVSMTAIKKLALVGCGAVTQRYYLPVLKQLRECAVEYFVDSNLLNAKHAAGEYGGGDVTSDYRTVIHKVDGAIVAVPNDLHSAISVDFLKAGRHVLCEKPIANSSKNAMQMIRASRESGARLAVNLFRRRQENYRILKDFLNRSFVGKITRISYQEGDPLLWPFSSPYLLRKDRSGGGVLIDWGAHSIDTLNWLFGNNWELVSYKDDSLDRIESNCIVDFIIEWHQTRVPCHVELSYTRRLGRRMVLEGDSCQITVDEFGPTNEIQLRTATDTLTITTGKNPKSFISYFAEQIRSFVEGARDDYLAGEDAINSLRFIEECYSKKENLSYPWEGADARPPTISSRSKRILIIGASGFLGTRLAERLSLDFGLNVRAAYHRPARAVRLARLPVELIECNVLDQNQVLQAVKGCDVIVNCAIGTSGDPKTAMQVYVQGTRNLLDAAKLHGVKKFVHISTAAVNNFKQKTREADESCAYKSILARDPYVKGKIAQEKLVTRFAKSVPTVVLRPTLIYGPYSQSWAVEIADSLINRKPTLVENGGLANLVYVDDVVDAILLAIEKEEANGRTLIVNNDDEVVQWSDYVAEFAKLTQTSPNVLPRGNLDIIRLKGLLSLCRDSAVAFWDNLGSREMLVLLARIPLVVVLGLKVVRGPRRKHIEEIVSAQETPTSNLAKGLAKYETMPSSQHENLTCHTVFSSSLAKTTLGWKPRTSFAEGSRKTLIWTEWAGLGREK